MNDMIRMVNNNQGLFSLGFSFIVAISTVIYAFLTWRLTRETIAMKKAQTEPKIAFFLERCRVAFHFFDLVIKNIGLGPAYEVTFKILEEFPIRDNKKLSEIDFIKEGISYMPPDYAVRTYLLSFLGEKNYENITKNIKIEIKYKNSNREQITEIIDLNMSQFKGIQGLGEDPLNKIAQNIESISKNVDHLASGYRHLTVDTYCSEDREKNKEQS